jgi:hypothetical protein
MCFASWECWESIVGRKGFREEALGQVGLDSLLCENHIPSLHLDFFFCKIWMIQIESVHRAVAGIKGGSQYG